MAGVEMCLTENIEHWLVLGMMCCGGVGGRSLGYSRTNPVNMSHLLSAEVVSGLKCACVCTDMHKCSHYLSVGK